MYERIYASLYERIRVYLRGCICDTCAFMFVSVSIAIVLMCNFACTDVCRHASIPYACVSMLVYGTVGRTWQKTNTRGLRWRSCIVRGASE